MENIVLNNGENVIIGSNTDIVELIKEQFSFELGVRLENILDSLETENNELLSNYWNLEGKIDDVEEENALLEEENWRLQKELENIKQKQKTKKKIVTQDELDDLPFC